MRTAREIAEGIEYCMHNKDLCDKCPFSKYKTVINQRYTCEERLMLEARTLLQAQADAIDTLVSLIGYKTQEQTQGGK